MTRDMNDLNSAASTDVEEPILRINKMRRICGSCMHIFIFHYSMFTAE